MQKNKTKTAKRILACIMVVVMTLTAVPLSSLVGLDLSGVDLLTGKAKAYSEGNYTYRIEKGEAIITGYNDTVYEDIVIPSSFDGYKVTGIDEGAFKSCNRITGVTIPESVKSIGHSAFRSCAKLKSVKMGNNVQEIGECAFYECKALENINLSSQITVIRWMTFEDCYSLKNIIIPEKVQAIHGYAFNDTALENIILPKSVLNVFKNAFDTKTLKKFTVLNKDCMFENSDALRSDELTIYGYKNSTAYTYAYENGYKFVPFCTNGHNYTNLKERKATTTQDGYRKGTCATCTFVENTVIPKVTSFSLSATSYIYDGNVKTPSVTVKDSKGKTLKNGTDYTVSYASGRKSVGQYAVKINLKGNYSGSKTLTFNIVPPATSKIAVAQSANAIKAAWKAVSGATGYKVYLYNGSKLVKAVVTKNTSYTFTSLSAGTTYKVYVKAYRTVNGKNFWSASKSLSTSTRPGTPTLSAAAGTKKATLKWNKQTGATGYVVYMATSKTGKYSRIAVLKGNSAVSFTKTGLTKGRTYYFKVAAYKTVGSSNLYGSFSAVKAVKVK
ncbi:MAG: leucine-rich repeat protein [Oscillospiraceae bacterium]|nr:leucine-rich repeat protein [Oscillospiraceae bacterium]